MGSRTALTDHTRRSQIFSAAMIEMHRLEVKEQILKDGGLTSKTAGMAWYLDNLINTYRRRYAG